MCNQQNRIWCLIVVMSGGCLTGCATTAFDKLAMNDDLPVVRGNLDCDDSCDSTSAVDLERGKRRPIVDGVGWVVGIPKKIILWDSRAENHRISFYTQHELVSYMERNHLHDTKVRVNQYDPIGEWKRLASNKKVGPGWRLTLGTLHTLGYTILPGRIFGNDSYNPYTDTVNIYSDIPALALEQAAFAKDVRQRSYPGTYAAVQELPVVGLWHEHRNKQDVYNYYGFYGEASDQREARHILEPQFGSEIGQQIDGVLGPAGGPPLFQLTGAAVGHVVGRVKGAKVPVEQYEERREQHSEELPLVAPASAVLTNSR